MSHSHPDRVRLKIDHPGSAHPEAFLNSWSEPFEPSEPFTPERAGEGGYSFRSAVSHIQVEIMFFDSQQEAGEYGSKHFNPVTPKSRWGMNGGFLYVVRGTDEDLVASLAGHFAGKE